MEATVIRFCPKCGARVRAAESVFEGPCACPTCLERSQFYDYPREPIASPPEPKSKPTITWYDRLFWFALATAGLAIVITLWSLWHGMANAALVGAAICLVVGIGLVGNISRLKRDLAHVGEAKKRAERALKVSNSQLQAATEIQHGFKKNFDSLITEEKRRLQNDISARQEKTKKLESEAIELMSNAQSQNNCAKLLGERLLDDSIDRISREINSSNLSSCRRWISDVIQFCRANGYQVGRRRENDLMERLTMDHQTTLQKAKRGHEQQRIEAKMREEQHVLSDMEQQIRNAEAERSAIKKNLTTVLKQSNGEDSEEVASLREKLQAAEEKAQQAMAIAQGSQSGYVYVLSNFGSFGPNVFKIGTTRRINPQEFVDELGSLAVPFPYDVHMMIACEDAPKLEAALHESLHESRVNRVNLSRDYFRTDIKTIWQLVVAHHGNVAFSVEPEAVELNESMKMTDEDFQRITELHESFEADEDPWGAAD